MEFKEVLEKAWSDVSSANLPESLHEIAFTQAMRHHSGDATVTGSVLVAAPPEVEGEALALVASAPRPNAGTDLFDVLSAETGVSRDLINELLYLDGEGQPQINLPGRKLGGDKSKRVRAIAITIGAARHYGLNEIETSLDVIREQCIALNSYDPNNFTGHISKAPGLVLTGPPRKKMLRGKSDLGKVFATTVAGIFGTQDGE